VAAGAGRSGGRAFDATRLPEAVVTTFVERLGRLDSCAVSDALDALGFRGVALGLQRLSTVRQIVGRAVTVQLEASSGEPAKRHLGVRATEQASSGDVIVVANRGRTEAAAWGGLLSLAAQRKGVAGVVVDGMCRDLDEAQQLGFPVFARGAVPVTARGRFSEVSTDGPVTIAGIEVCSGDLVIADGSGVVFVQAGQAATVLDAAEEIAVREEAMAEAINAGKSLAEVLDERYERLLKGWSKP
jgi:regulator of RNase E activity RraA